METLKSLMVLAKTNPILRLPQKKKQRQQSLRENFYLRQRRQLKVGQCGTGCGSGRRLPQNLLRMEQRMKKMKRTMLRML